MSATKTTPMNEIND